MLELELLFLLDEPLLLVVVVVEVDSLSVLVGSVLVCSCCLAVSSACALAAASSSAFFCASSAALRFSSSMRSCSAFTASCSSVERPLT